MIGWRRWLTLAVDIALLVLAYFLVPVQGGWDSSELLRLLVTIVALGSLTAVVFWQVLLQLEHPDRRIDGLVLALVFAVLGFALGFYVMELRSPAQIAGLHTRLDALYFTVTTLLTVGYGDVHAEGQAARSLVLVQMVFNVAVIATAASTLTTRVRRAAVSRAETRRSIDPGSDQGHPRRQGRRTHRNPT